MLFSSLVHGAFVAKRSAGLLMYRQWNSDTQVLLLHPGGPFWAGKGDGAWTIPKGEIEEGEETQEAAKREFEEETGLLPRGDFYPLKPVKLKSGKIIYAWAFKGDWDPATIKSVTFTMEFPPRSGRILECPEADRAAWFTLEQAKMKIQEGQVGLIEELSVLISPTGHKAAGIAKEER